MANFFPRPTAVLLWKRCRGTTTHLLRLLSNSWWSFWFQPLSSHSCVSFSWVRPGQG